MPAPADPELTIQRAATAVVIAQGPLVARIGAVAAMSAIPTLLLAAALFALVPPIMAAGVAAATLLMDGLVAWAFVRVAMARVELRITAGEIAATSAPAPTRTVRFDTARLRRLRVERGGARVKLVPGRPSVRVAVVAELDDGATRPVAVCYGRARAASLAAETAAAVAAIGGPTIAVDGT